MFYYKFITNTPYCGTEAEEYYAFDEKPTEQELEEIGEQFCRSNAESYEYLATGWDSDDLSEEDLDEELSYYYDNCEYSWEEITREEYEENT